MFEEELELEKEQGKGFGPLLVVVGLAILLIGGVIYTLHLAHQTLSPEQAAAVVSSMMPRPAATSFTTGHVAYSQGDNIANANYKLLAKLGVLKVVKGKNGDGDVSLTPAGEKLLASIRGVSRKTDAKTNTTAWRAPIAERRLTGVSKVVKLGVNRYQVTYEWRWETNELGRSFDMQGKDVECLNSWEKQSLIDKFGGAFYSEKTLPATLVLEKGDKGWKLGEQ